MPGKGGLQLTGKLGEVIRESAQIALSWVKGHAYDLGITTTIDEQFLMTGISTCTCQREALVKKGPAQGQPYFQLSYLCLRKQKLTLISVRQLKRLASAF